MREQTESGYTCKQCGIDVKEQDTYCPNCGTIFAEHIVCSNHLSADAAGMCVICRKPFCKDCCVWVEVCFVCNEHSEFEIYEGMAKVYETTDNVQSQFVTSCLEQGGFHPFLYSRRFNPGADIANITKMYRVFGKHTIAGLKVLVPFEEALNARDFVKELLSPSNIVAEGDATTPKV